MKFYVKTKISKNKSKTPEGFLLCRNVMLTHTGALRYMPGEHPFGDEVGEVVMKRKPEELFSLATLASFEGKDITIQHPEDFIAPENYQELTNGVLLNVREGKEQIEVEGEKVTPMLGDLLIKSADAIAAVENEELEEVSLGYDALWELTSKTEGLHSKIIGNHCALVEAGRAGKHCSIIDHKKEKELMGKEALEKFKKLFGKTVDEAMKEKEDEEKKAKDAEEAEKKKKEEDDKKAKDAEEAEKKKKEEESSDDEEGSDLSKRMDSLESKLDKLLEKLSGSESEDEDESEVVAEDEEDEESEDEEASDEGYEGEDEEESEEKPKKKAGDSVLSRAEILAPGIEKSKDIMTKALAKAYKTADGKKVIDSLTAGKGPSKLSKEAEVAVFTAAAEMLKTKRVRDFASQRVTTIDSFPGLKGTGAKSADDINKQNAEFYKNGKQ